MLVKLNPELSAVERLKSVTGTKTASKAYEIAGRDLPGMLSHIEDLYVEREELKQTIQVLRSTMEGARDAAALLLERTSQKDLFTD